MKTGPSLQIYLLPILHRPHLPIPQLIRLSRAFNTAVVVTNQVMAQPDAFFAKVVQPVGGHVMGHTSHTRIFLRKGRNNLRIAKLVVSPFLPEGETPLRITERGVEGDEDI